MPRARRVRSDDLGFQALRPALGIRGSAMLVGAFALGLAFVSPWGLEETYGKELDYLELP